ncbi:SDR family NAD(P)-dependent oxidoreductase [Streptomyces sp. NPDC059629]|uniref:SDR family NAD(P)-dependent oxidoreductase n=1 Tax=Streptomyces sp. NPDC059629 TaxID=3346889 RepID=UPI0036A116CA
MTARFRDKVVVTGAGAGIGRASARAFAREGAAVVAAGARPDFIEETVRLVGEDGGTASAVVADVTRPEDMQRLVRTAVERHGGLHVAHNTDAQGTAPSEQLRGGCRGPGQGRRPPSPPRPGSQGAGAVFSTARSPRTPNPRCRPRRRRQRWGRIRAGCP